MERVVRDYADMIYRIALNDTRSPQDAEDILQEVLLARFLRRDFRDPEHEKRWLIRVTLNKGRDLKRALIRHPAAPLDELYAVSAPQGPDYSALRAAVASLPRGQRRVIDLYYFEGMTTAQIAGILSAPEATVRTRLRRARLRLREILGEEWNDE